MGRRSSYFRHSFNAHQDPKIVELIETGGVRAVGVYFILLEMYGNAISNDDAQSPTQYISARRLATNCKLRVDSLQNCVTKILKCDLSERLCYRSDTGMIEVCIPNFFKYYGFYKKTSTTDCPKESKGKQKKTNIKKPTSESEDVDPFIKSVIDVTNSIMSTALKYNTKISVGNINKRQSEGFVLEDFELVVKSKYLEWKDNPDMRQYLTTQTMFGNKFEGYLQTAKLSNDNKSEADEADDYFMKLALASTVE